MITLDNKIPMRWWDNQLNFGDLLGPWLVEKMTGKKPVWTDRKTPHYLVVGSILGRVSPSSIAWGIGSFGSEEQKNIETNATYLAVRGPLTRNKLQMRGVECPRVYGDPALLVPEYYHPKIEKKYEVGVVIRWSEKKRRKQLEKIPGILLIDLLTDEIESVLNKFLSCKKIVSTSLHGLVIADAYGIPNAWIVAHTGAGMEFKFWDYLISVNKCRKPVEVNFEDDFVDLEFLLDRLPYDSRSIDINLDLLKKACPFTPLNEKAESAESKSLEQSSVSGALELIDFKWLDKTTLEVGGIAMPLQGKVKGGHSVLNVWLESDEGRFIETKRLSTVDFSLVPSKQNPKINLSKCGFSAIFDFSEVAEKMPSHSEPFILKAELSSELGKLVTKATSRSSVGAIQKMHASHYFYERLITPEWTRNGLTLFFRKPSIKIIDFNLQADCLKVTAESISSFVPSNASIWCDVTGEDIEPVSFTSENKVYEVVFDLTKSFFSDELTKKTFLIKFSLGDKTRNAHVCLKNLDTHMPVSVNGFEVYRSPRGLFRLRLIKKSIDIIPVETFLAASSEVPKIALLCSGTIGEGIPFLSGSREDSSKGYVDKVNNNEFIVYFDLSHDTRAPLFSRGNKKILPGGDYCFMVSSDSGPVAIKTLGLIRELPIKWSHSALNIVLFPGKDDLLYAKISAPLKSFELGEYNQRNIAEKYKDTPLIDAFYFESWFGKSVSDNSLGIINQVILSYPETPVYVGVQDSSVGVPAGVTPLQIGSQDWWYTVSSCKYIVNNSWFSSKLIKKKGQKWVQTWHGTPLKKLGLDREDVSRTERGVSKSSNKWDLLVSQNHFSTEVFRRAYRYSGDVIECGYPRNDVFFDEQAFLGLRNSLRDYFGIDNSKKVILYAPTWREHDRDEVGLLDVPTLTSFFDDDYVFLVRGHSITLKRGGNVVGRNVIDVTSYPDLAPLIACSDLLITDYSSLMFDYTLTGKPVIFYCPDWEYYSGPGRGVYFDLKAIAPGPFLTSIEEVKDAVLNIDLVQKQYARKYQEWNAEFNPWSDGASALSIIKHLKKIN